MALKLNERYPGRFDNPTEGYPQGSFKNRTTPTSKDGSYLEKDWANDCLGFLSSLLSAAGVSPNGSVDEVGASQYFDALQVLSGNKVTTVSETAALNKSQGGLVLASASAAAITITLPAASEENGILEFVIRRADETTNALVITATGADKIMLDTTSTPTGLASTELLFSGDYLRLRSDGSGKWWCVGKAQLPARIESGFTVYTTPGVYTYSVPAVLRAGRRIPRVRVIGGGGSGATLGGGVHSTGGASGASWEGAIDLSGVSSVTITVGAGGIARTVGGQDGANGAASSFGALVSCSGGQGGLRSGNLPSGGAVTTALIGGISIGGQQGGISVLSSTGGSKYGGHGGSTVMGQGGQISSSSGAPTGFGSGSGGGAVNDSLAGAGGFVGIEW